MRRTTQKTYAEGMKSFDALMVEVDDARAQMDSLGKKLQREEEASAVQMEIIIGHRAEIRDLEALVQLATQPQKAVPSSFIP